MVQGRGMKTLVCVCVCVSLPVFFIYFSWTFSLKQVVINIIPNWKRVLAFGGVVERGTDKKVQMVGSALATS